MPPHRCASVPGLSDMTFARRIRTLRRVAAIALLAACLPPVASADWEQVTKCPGWRIRREHTSVIHAGKTWVIGGTPFNNEVWYSGDGMNWTEATSCGPWVSKDGHRSVVHEDKLWLIADGSNVWYSPDGVNWTDATQAPPWSGQYDAEVETIAMRVAIGSEQDLGADVRDVSKPQLARAIGLDDWCGFDLRSKRLDGTQIATEVKGRARTGEIELSENEWAKACTLGDKYWLYVVYDCATANPRLIRVQDPIGKLLAKIHGGAIINASEVYAAAEEDAP